MFRDKTERVSLTDRQKLTGNRNTSPLAGGRKAGSLSAAPKITGLRIVPDEDQIYFIARINPMGKPRMTRSDKWKERPCVVAYREWCDRLRAAAPELPEKPRSLEVVAYIEIPERWSAKRKANMRGRVHERTPDLDNIIKGIMDCLFPQDKSISRLVAEKRWDDGNGPRMEIAVG